jgi:hypothetical protein
VVTLASSCRMLTTNTLVLQTVLDELGAQPGQVLLPMTTPLRRFFREPSLTTVRRVLLQELGVRDQEVAQKLLESLDESRTLSECFSVPSACVVPDSADLDRLFEVEGEIVQQWPHLRERYPATRGVLDVGIPIYDQAEKSVVFYMGRTLGPKCGTGWLYSLSNDGGHWKAQKKMGLWVS